MNISAAVSDSVQIKKDGLYLSISPITSAHQGRYVCLVKHADMDILRTYDITVIGEKHACFHCSCAWQDHVAQQTPCLCLSAAVIADVIHAIEGSTIYLPCYFPHSSQIPAKAVWYKETDEGPKYLLEESSAKLEQVQQLYPLVQDQSLVFRDVLLEDSGMYHCTSAQGEDLSTIQVTVKGRLITLWIHHSPHQGSLWLDQRNCTETCYNPYITYRSYLTYDTSSHDFMVSLLEPPVYTWCNKITTVNIVFAFCKSIITNDDIIKLC